MRHGGGATLVCLAAHGERIWGEQARALSVFGANAIFPDLSRDDSVADMCGRVLSVAPARFCLIAHCMGGYVAFELLRRAPDRIARLALFNTSARGDADWQVRARRARIESLSAKRADEFPSEDYIDDALLWMLAPAHQTSPRIREQASKALGGLSLGAACRQQRAMLARCGFAGELAGIDIPALVVAGKGDRMCSPDLAREIAAAVPGSELHVLDPCGHLPMFERPDEVAHLLRRWMTEAKFAARRASPIAVHMT